MCNNMTCPNFDNPPLCADCEVERKQLEDKASHLRDSWDRWCKEMCVEILGMDENFYGGTCKATRYIEFHLRKLVDLKRQIAEKDAVLHRKNVELDALGKVWCNGGCDGGMFRFTDGELTQEIVDAVNRNTERLNRYWKNYNMPHRIERRKRNEKP